MFDAELCLLADMVLAWEIDGYVFQTNVVQCFLHFEKYIAYFLWNWISLLPHCRIMNGTNQGNKNGPRGKNGSETPRLSTTSVTPQPQSRMRDNVGQTGDNGDKVRLPQIIPSNRQREYSESMMPPSFVMLPSGVTSKTAFTAPGPMSGRHYGGTASSRYSKSMKEGMDYYYFINTSFCTV